MQKKNECVVNIIWERKLSRTDEEKAHFKSGSGKRATNYGCKKQEKNHVSVTLKVTKINNVMNKY